MFATDRIKGRDSLCDFAPQGRCSRASTQGNREVRDPVNQRTAGALHESLGEHVARAKALKPVNRLRRLTGDKAIAQPTLMREVLSNSKTPCILGHGLSRPGPCKTAFRYNTFDSASGYLDRAGVEYVTYHGGISEKAESKAVDAFAANAQKRWFLGNSVSAMVGISLTAADRLYFADMSSLRVTMIKPRIASIASDRQNR